MLIGSVQAKEEKADQLAHQNVVVIGQLKNWCFGFCRLGIC
jgi:hypothetical protein